MTRAASEISESHCRTKRDKLFLGLAKALSQGKGYLIATPAELVARFPYLFTEIRKRAELNGPDADRKFIWGIDASRPLGCKKFEFSFIPI